MVRVEEGEEEKVRLLDSPEPDRRGASLWAGGAAAAAAAPPTHHHHHHLSVGMAEKAFYAVSGNSCSSSSSSASKDDSSCDTRTKVPDSLEVVREILEEIEEQDNVDCEECRGGLAAACPTASGSLVVDVHLEGCQDLPRRCTKHTLDRFPRCYSESYKSRGPPLREELRNLDRIETIGEERLRHLSEGARRGRAATLSSELKQLRRSFLSTRSSAMTESEAESVTSPVNGSIVSCNSNVKFEIFEEGGSGSDCDYVDAGSGSESGLEAFRPLPPPHPLVASLRNGGAGTQPTMSNSSSTTSMPICRICQLPSLEPSNHLISPCRCLGSIRYVHNPCLLKWLEVSARKHSGPPCCELCQFQYLRHKKFVVSHFLFPSCSTRDKILHAVFTVAIAVMVACAAVTILCFKQDRVTKPKVVGQTTQWSPSELMTLSCGVLFFLAFFVAMYVEVKAKYTIYQLICKFCYMNHEWSIEEYDRRKDPAKQLESP